MGSIISMASLLGESCLVNPPSVEIHQKGHARSKTEGFLPLPVPSLSRAFEAIV